MQSPHTSTLGESAAAVLISPATIGKQAIDISRSTDGKHKHSRLTDAHALEEFVTARILSQPGDSGCGAESATIVGLGVVEIGRSGSQAGTE